MNTLELLTALNRDLTDEELLVEYPFFPNLDVGTYSFYLHKNSVENIKDIGRDCFSPWTGRGITGLKQTKSYTKNVKKSSDNIFELDSSGELHLKYLKNVHTHKPQLKRNIAYVVNNQGQLVTHVFHHYSTKSFVAVDPKKQRILPSVSNLIKQSMEYRCTAQAKKKLFDSGLIVDSKQMASNSRSCSNHIKSKQEKYAATDAYKIYDRFLKKSYVDEEILDKPVIESREDGVIVFRTLVAFPAAFRHFNVGLPTLEDITDYQAEVENMLLGTEREIENDLIHYFQNSNASGAYPLIGSHIQIDTTFSLCSAEYVTFIVGVSDSLLHTESKKSSSVILAYMIHSHRKSDDHANFSRFLCEIFNKFCPGKSPGAIIHDGEKTFNCYDEIFPKAVNLRCDVHRLDNIKSVLKNCGNLIDSDYVQKKLFGVKQRGNGGQFLVSGILNKLTYDKFLTKMLEFMNESPEPLKEWLLLNEKSLFSQNSFVSKITAGLFVQFATTNVIEEKNSYIKQLITCKLPGEKLMDSLLHFHRKFRVMGTSEQKMFLSSYGLNDLTLGNTLHEFPQWALDGNKITREQLTHIMRNLKCYDTIAGNVFFLTRSDMENEVVKVSLIEKTLHCSSTHCKLRKKYLLCPHMLVVLKRVEGNLKASILEKLQSIHDLQTCMQIMTTQMRPEHGTKFNYRKGKQMSKNNAPRSIERLQTTFEEHSLSDNSFTESSFSVLNPVTHASPVLV